MSRALRLWPLLTGTHRYEKLVSTRDRGHGLYIHAPILAYLIELPRGRPVILCGDAAGLQENLSDEVAPGYCWQDNVALALASIRKLNALAHAEGAEPWPNHDVAFFNRQPLFPAWRD